MDGEWTDLPMIFSELWSNEVWYPLKYIKTGRFLDVFRRERKRLVLWNGLGLVVKVPYSQSRGLIFKTTGCLQGHLSFSSFWGWSNEYQEFQGVVLKQALTTNDHKPIVNNHKQPQTTSKWLQTTTNHYQTTTNKCKSPANNHNKNKSK